MNKKNITTSLFVALVIGSLLNLINSYEVFAKGRFTSTNIIKITVTYIIPFCVSMYSSIKATKYKA